MLTEDGATVSVTLIGTEEGSTDGEDGEGTSKVEEGLGERRRGTEEGLEDLLDDRRDDLEEDFLTADEDTTGTLG